MGAWLFLLWSVRCWGSALLYTNTTVQSTAFQGYSFVLPSISFSYILIRLVTQPDASGSFASLLLASKDRYPFAYVDTDYELRYGSLAADLPAYAFKEQESYVQLNTSDLNTGSTVYVGVMIPSRPILGASLKLDAIGHGEKYADGNQCPNNCTERGECTQGACVCSQPWGAVDCSLKISYLDLGQQYDMIIASDNYRHFTAVYRTDSSLRLELERLQGSVVLLISFGRSPEPPTEFKFDTQQAIDNATKSLDLYFDVSRMGPYGVLFALYNSELKFHTQAVISITFTQSAPTSSANVYVIVGVLLGCTALCVSCCLVCLKFFCRRRKTRRRNARVHVYHNWNVSASVEQDKSLFDSSKIQLDPENVQECTICLDAMTDEKTLLMLPCKHMFHTTCINAWFEKQNFCCVCKAVYDISRSFEPE